MAIPPQTDRLQAGASGAFTHRVLTGWISEYACRPLPGPWPQIPLDDETLGDFDRYFELCRDSGYNEVVVWGPFVDRCWPVELASCVDGDRRERLHRLIEAAHDCGLLIHCGLGLYSWGFEAIIAAQPELARTNRQVMCPAVPAAWEWMTRVVDQVLEFPFDGLNMQSADQGRCECDDCVDLTTVEYHAGLSRRVADYIRTRWPDRCLIFDNWGCPFDEPNGIPALAAAAEHLGYVIDCDNSAAGLSRTHRQALIDALPCPLGTLAGRSIWPPQRWPRHRWLVPTTLTNVDYLRQLHGDGGRAAEQFVTTLANPSGEVTLRFMGRLLADVDADPHSLLRAAVAATYQPRRDATLDALVEVVCRAEAAFFQYRTSDRRDREVGLIFVDGGLTHDGEPNPAAYLRDMTPEARAAYGGEMLEIARLFEQVRDDVEARTTAALTARCLLTAHAEAVSPG